MAIFKAGSCTREYKHTGPCNGEPRRIAFNVSEGKQIFCYGYEEDEPAPLNIGTANPPVESLSVLAVAAQDTGDHMRKDDGKSRIDLIPPEAIEALGHLYGVGALKYRPRGWEEGMSWGRCFASMMRHAWKWARGEDFDPETKAHHMIAVAWNAFALYTYACRKVGVDDRKVLI